MCAAITALLLKERDGFFIKKTLRDKNIAATPLLNIFRQQNSILISDLPPCAVALFPRLVRCANTTQKIAAETWLNTNRTTRSHALRGLSARKQEVNNTHLMEPTLHTCLFLHSVVTDFFKSNQIQHTIKNQHLGCNSKHTKVYFTEASPVPIEIWLILPVVICLFQGLSHACLRITALQDSAHGSLHQT